MSTLNWHEDLTTELKAGHPVTEEKMHAAGFSKPVLDAAQKLGLNWLSLIALFQQYGPAFLKILLDLIAHQEKPK